MGDRERASIAVGMALRKRRTRAGMSQEEVASGGIALSHVSDLERGLIDPRLSTLLQLAAILGVPFATFAAEIARNFVRLNGKTAASPPPEA